MSACEYYVFNYWRIQPILHIPGKCIELVCLPFYYISLTECWLELICLRRVYFTDRHALMHKSLTHTWCVASANFIYISLFYECVWVDAGRQTLMKYCCVETSVHTHTRTHTPADDIWMPMSITNALIMYSLMIYLGCNIHATGVLRRPLENSLIIYISELPHALQSYSLYCVPSHKTSISRLSLQYNLD